MAPFVDFDEYLGYADDSADQNLAYLALESACAMVREHLCQQVNAVAGDTVTLAGSGTRVLLLPELPVTALTSVVDGDGVTVDPLTYTLDDYGCLWRVDPDYWPRGTQYVVTYSHGWATTEVPADIKISTFRLAHSIYSGAGSTAGEIQSESVAGYSVTYATGATSGDSAGILAELGGRRVKRIAVP